jgi:hypothetical protein
MAVMRLKNFQNSPTDSWFSMDAPNYQDCRDYYHNPGATRLLVICKSKGLQSTVAERPLNFLRSVGYKSKGLSRTIQFTQVSERGEQHHQSSFNPG